MRVSTPRFSANRLLITFTAFLGMTTSVGIVLGWMNTGSRHWRSATLLLVFSLAFAIFLTHPNGLGNVRRSTHKWVPAALPAIFILTSVRWLFQPAGVRLAWLIDTWDGTTNPGVVTYSYITGSIGRDARVLSQWEMYPRAPHFLLSQIQHVLDLFGVQSISTRATTYALGLWVTYALVILAVGVLARAVLDTTHLTSRTSLMAIPLIQLPIGLSCFLDRTLFLHSLSFFAAIIGSIAQLAHWLTLRQQPKTTWKDVAVFALCTTVVIETFPLLLPVSLVTWLLFLLRSTRSGTTDGWKSIVVLALVSAIAMPRLHQQAVHSAASDHIALGGHIFALPVWTLLLAVAVMAFTIARTWCQSKNSAGGAVTAIAVAILLAPAVSWATVGNFDRVYGVNYYPKRVEYFGFLAALSLLPALVFSFPKLRNIKLSVRAFIIFICAVATFFVCLGPGRKPTVVARDSGTAKLVTAALREAAFESESIIANGDTYSSTLASMLSNLLDLRNWSRGYVNERLLGFYQQVSVRLNVEPDESLCDILTDSRAVIVRLDGGIANRERCRR
jgi:hypothetical protein